MLFKKYFLFFIQKFTKFIKIVTNPTILIVLKIVNKIENLIIYYFNFINLSYNI
jgi:hypothetical protein